MNWIEIAKLDWDAEMAAAVMGCHKQTARKRLAQAREQLGRPMKERLAAGARSVAAETAGAELRAVTVGMVVGLPAKKDEHGRRIPQRVDTIPTQREEVYVGQKDSGWRTRDKSLRIRSV